MVVQQSFRALNRPMRGRGVALSAAAVAALAGTVASPVGTRTASADSVVATIPVGLHPLRVAAPVPM